MNWIICIVTWRSCGSGLSRVARDRRSSHSNDRHPLSPSQSPPSRPSTRRRRRQAAEIQTDLPPSHFLGSPLKA